MAFLQGKTPISFLQELCTKRGITPQYDLIANEGAVHEPTFVFKVIAGDYQGTGKGPSKKKAKQNAALSVLNKMMGMVNGGPVNQVDDYTKLSQPGATDALSGNPVGELQELTQKKLWPPPQYDFTSEQGPPHACEFICTIRLYNLKETGNGRSKKLAKRNAAYQMLQLIKQGEEPDVVPEDEEAILANQSDIKATYTNLKEGGKRVASLGAPTSQRISQFYQGLKAKQGNHLANLQAKNLNMASFNYCQMLQEIAEEQRFEVTYVDIPEPSLSGQFQCLIQLSSMPVAVCHGSGKTKDEARALAAHNALQYLKIMTKAKPM